MKLLNVKVVGGARFTNSVIQRIYITDKSISKLINQSMNTK
jgi:hypothetical protein